jgi:hypothetical protein
MNAGMARGSPEHLAPGATLSFALYGASGVQKGSLVFSGTNVDPSLLRHDLQYHTSTSDSFLSRTSYAVSRLFITRDDSGKKKVNTSYLLAVLASAAVARNSAYLPYRKRTASATFGDFGSTVGGDAGKNIFHQFWPRIHQMLGAHSSKVSTRINERPARDPMPATLASTSAR